MADADWLARWRRVRGREHDAHAHFLDSAEEWLFSRFTMPSGRRIALLDAGCGNGAWTRDLRDLGVDAIGLDVDVGTLRDIRGARPDVPVVGGDMHRLPFADDTFDALLSSSVMQYGEWRAIVAEYARVLRPGGEAVLIVNLAAHPLARAYRAAHRLLGWRYAPHQTPVRHFEWDDRHELAAHLSHVEHDAMHLLTPLALIPAVVRRRLLGREWRVAPGSVYRVLRRIDVAILRHAPVLRRYCWLMVVYARR